MKTLEKKIQNSKLTHQRKILEKENLGKKTNEILKNVREKTKLILRIYKLFFKKLDQDQLMQEKNISELQNDDLKIEQTLQKRIENHERLQKTFNVDQGLYENNLKENESLKETISNLKLEIELKNKNLSQKKEELNEKKDQKKSIETRVYLTN